MHVFILFPHICNSKLSSECANSCKCVSYSKALLGGVLILVDVENWLGTARMCNGYIKINKKKKNESDITLDFHY